MRYCLKPLFVIVLCLPCLAQSLSQRISLELGSVTVWLGMPHQEVVNKFVAAGYKLNTDLSDKRRVVFEGVDHHFYTLQFIDERMTYADREWFSSKSGSDAFQTTIAALGSISDSRSVTCSLSHEPSNKPEMQADRLFISCGKRSFLLMDARTRDEHYYTVSERIGMMQ